MTITINTSKKRPNLAREADRKLLGKRATVLGGGIPRRGRIVAVVVTPAKRIFVKMELPLGRFTFPFEALTEIEE